MVLGTFLHNNYNQKATKVAGAYSSKLKEKLQYVNVNLYDNLEIFLLYTRGFNGALSGNLAFQESTESYSPFYDVDFFEYCLSIPIKYRVDHKIYFKWIKSKYPEAAKYYYEKLHGKINTPLFITKNRWFIIRCINKFLKIIGLNGLYGTFTKNAMNPFDYWYENNKELQKFINSQYNDNIELLDFDKDVKEACIYLFNNGIMTEKFQVLTLLSVTKLLF
ncbi:MULTISPECIES: hypothetical protein [Clostridium]|uniref:Uncharacterized protein n=1 Tax=Clostridium lapidicellarium TaxID=3240931 RepID=A0ABV4DZL5_9CLOT